MPVLFESDFSWCILFVLCISLHSSVISETTHENDFCKQPNLTKLRVIKAFQPTEGSVEGLLENNYAHALPKETRYYKGTIIFVECVESSQQFTTIHDGSLKYTCVKSSDSKDSQWDRPFPDCVSNICWWPHEDNKRIQFRYRGQILTEKHRGFPKGTELTFPNCPRNHYANMNPIRCTSMGNWNYSYAFNYPACAEEKQEKNSSYLIWASLVTTIFFIQTAFLIILCRKLSSKQCQQVREQAPLTSFERLPPEGIPWTYLPIMEISTSDDVHGYSLKGSYRNDNAHFKVSESPTYEEPLDIAGQKLRSSPVPIYAVPTGKKMKPLPVINSTSQR